MRDLLFILVLGANMCFAQFSDSNEKGVEFQVGNTSAPYIRVTTDSGNKVVGSEYLNEEWEQAIITDINHQKKITLLARFSAYTGEIELLKEKDVVALKPIEGLSIELNNKTFVQLEIEGSTKTIFAEQLVRGKISLYRVFETKVKKAPSDAGLLGIDSDDKLIIVDKLYWQNNNELASKLPKKKKQLENALTEETQKYIKKEKLSLKKEADLIRAFIFQNSSS